MQFSYFLGIDISKNSLDLCFIQNDEVLAEDTCKNSLKSISKSLRLLVKSIPLKRLLVCAEHTGLYSYPLIEACEKLGICIWLENPLAIKKSSGIIRGKNDQVDAERIAMYAYRFQDKARLYTSQDSVLQQLRALNSERQMYVIDRAGYQAQLKDQEGFMDAHLYKAKARRLNRLINHLTLIIQNLEQQMDKLISECAHLSNQYRLITSVQGVGRQTAIQTMISTNAFTSFSDPRKFCCHTGVAPFAYFSGTSKKSKWKVSHQASKQLKKLYHMAALSAINVEGELQQYYIRKIKEGKNKMSVINAIRAKIIHRVFAVIRDNRKYEKNYIPELG